MEAEVSDPRSTTSQWSKVKSDGRQRQRQEVDICRRESHRAIFLLIFLSMTVNEYPALIRNHDIDTKTNEVQLNCVVLLR